MALHDASDWLHEIAIPCAVVIPENDRVIPPAHQREMAALLPDARVFTHAEGHVACMNPAFGATLATACLDVLQRCQRRHRR